MHGDAVYYSACPLEGGCADVSEMWNRTSGTIEEAVTAAVASPAEQVFKVCHKMKYGLCDAPLLKGGLMLTDWDLGANLPLLFPPPR